MNPALIRSIIAASVGGIVSFYMIRYLEVQREKRRAQL